MKYRNQKGQVIVEYILLMVIVVAIASLLITQVVSRSSDSDKQGFLIKKWDQMIRVIGSDLPDKCDPTKAGTVGYSCR